MNIVTIVIAVLTGLLLFAALVPFTFFIHGFVRIFEFPRLQMLVLAVVVLAAAVLFIDNSAWRLGIVAALAVVIIVQLISIAQFTRIRSPQSKAHDGDPNGPDTVSLISCNVRDVEPGL